MRNKLLKLIPYLIILTLVYYLLPLVILDTGSAMSLLLVMLPAITFIVSIIYGIKNGINLLYVFAVALIFMPTILIYYNETAIIYVGIYSVIALIGDLIGSLCYRFKK